MIMNTAKRLAMIGCVGIWLAAATAGQEAAGKAAGSIRVVE